MLATPTGTALTGDTPSAAIRRPGTGTHAHPPDPLARHRDRPRRRRRALLASCSPTAATAAQRRPRDRRRPRPPSRPPDPAGVDFPIECGPAEGRWSRNRPPATSTATAAPRRSPWSTATPPWAPRPTASTSSRGPRTTPKPRVVATLVDPKDRLTVERLRRPRRHRHRDAPRLLVAPTYRSCCPDVTEQRQVAVEERRVRPLDTRPAHTACDATRAAAVRNQTAVTRSGLIWSLRVRSVDLDPVRNPTHVDAVARALLRGVDHIA